MTKIKELIWDVWNSMHIRRHGVTKEEIEEVCLAKHRIYKTYRGRIEVVGKTHTGRKLKIILSPEDRHLKIYKEGIYYLITAYEEGVEND